MTAYDPPLADLKVLDLATGGLAAIGRQLAELGADVVRIEPKAGHEDRRRGSRAAAVSVDFLAANLGKRFLACDLGDPDDGERFDALLSRADILIESCAPNSDAARRLDVAAIHRRWPGLVILSVSAFGIVGPLRDWTATEPVLQALSGNLSRSGIPDRPPLLPPGGIALQSACSQAVFVTLLAYLHRLQSGRGDRLDFSVLDGACQALDPGYGMAGSAVSATLLHRLPRGRPAVQHLYPIIPCADGFVRLCILAARQWQAMFDWMDRPAEFADESFNTLDGRFSSSTLIPRITEFFADKRRVAIENEGRQRGIPVASVLTLEELLQSKHLKTRQVLIDIGIDADVTAPFPNGILEMDGYRAGPCRSTSRLESDVEAVLREWTPSAHIDGPGSPAGSRPLEGLRVLDLGVIVVGAEQSRLLADQGADVIKVENAAFPDGSRQTSSRNSVSVSFAAGHRNKRGLGLNLRDPEGRALFLKLVMQSDVVASNFKPGTLESLGLGYDTLSALNPRLIMLQSSAFGTRGDWSGRMGYGPLVRAAAGLTSQWRYQGEPESFSDAFTVYPDHVAARVGALGVLALLIRRARTGRGGTLEVAQLDVMLGHMAAQIATSALRRTGVGVDDDIGDAPWGVYQAQGDDEWLVLTVNDDAQWRAFCEVAGRLDLLRDAALASAGGRVAQRERIDRAVRDWLASCPPQAAESALQAAGVAAARMLRVSDLPEFPHFAQRQFFRRAKHPTLPDWSYQENAPCHSECLADPPSGPAPLAGEHSVQIARTALQLSDADIDRLIRARVLETLESGA